MVGYDVGHLWTTAELAQEVGVNQSRLRQLLLAGRLHGYKRANVWLIPHEEAQRFLRQRQRQDADLSAGERDK